MITFLPRGLRLCKIQSIAKYSTAFCVTLRTCSCALGISLQVNVDQPIYLIELGSVISREICVLLADPLDPNPQCQAL